MSRKEVQLVSGIKLGSR